MDANRRECGLRRLTAPKRGVAGMVSIPALQDESRQDAFGGTPNPAVDPSPLRFDATRLTALPMGWTSGHSRLFAFIRGRMLTS